jgi:toxin-antitoxin system PIN domain toxin
MTSLVFPDVNVWLAMSHPAHMHHETALRWFHALDQDAVLVFCRHTQLGLFRLLTSEAVLRQDVRTQRQCWDLYDRWVEPGKAVVAIEPPEIEDELRNRTSSDSPNPKEWADAFLAAFAETAQLTLVTFDRALAGKAKGAVLLDQ